MRFSNLELVLELDVAFEFELELELLVRLLLCRSKLGAVELLFERGIGLFTWSKSNSLLGWSSLIK